MINSLCGRSCRTSRGTPRVAAIGVDHRVVPEWAGRGQRERLGQIPEQLVQRAQHREGVEHPPRGGRIVPPVPPTEGPLGQVLAGAEAVEDRAAGEAPLPQGAVDAAAGVGTQVWAGPAGGLVDHEVGGGGERRRDAADPEAAEAVGGQLVTGTGHRPLLHRLRHADPRRYRQSPTWRRLAHSPPPPKGPGPRVRRWRCTDHPAARPQPGGPDEDAREQGPHHRALRAPDLAQRHHRRVGGV